ncbi:MAG: CPBP family intramembrane metalloprotease [Lachnospiraceae bacterium]|nr:CPBP family intramembrane metalloprotease [Lachnospiraceae bacterium]
MKRMNDALKMPVLIIYVIAFYGIWTVWEFWIKTFISNTFGNECTSQLIKSGIIKNLVWTFPAILLVQHFKSDVYITLKEMFSTKVKWLKYLPIFIFFTVYILAGAILHNGEVEIVRDFGMDKIIIVLFVGLTEEMVFRGWLLNATIRENRKWFYIIINAVMFLAIHFPIWIYSGNFISYFTSLQFIEVMALSVIFSITFIKSRSILVPITLHMYFDLLVFMFI